MHWCRSGKCLNLNRKDSVEITMRKCIQLFTSHGPISVKWLLRSPQMSLAICEREKMFKEYCEEACRGTQGGSLTPQITFHNIGPGWRLDCKHSVLSRPQNGGWGLEKALGERQLIRNNSWESNSESQRTFSISTHVHVLSPSHRCHLFLNLYLTLTLSHKSSPRL